jgi:hypothetical protein
VRDLVQTVNQVVDCYVRGGDFALDALELRDRLGFDEELRFASDAEVEAGAAFRVASFNMGGGSENCETGETIKNFSRNLPNVIASLESDILVSNFQSAIRNQQSCKMASLTS